MEMKKKILLFNPRSTDYKPRIPNSILQIAACIYPQYDVVFVDGNLENDPELKIKSYLNSDCFFCVGITVMPGPQLKQAIPVTGMIKSLFPQLPVVWGGYFPSNHPKVVMDSGLVDVIINGPGDIAFPSLLKFWEKRDIQLSDIQNLIYLENGILKKTPKGELPDLDKLESFPYDLLNKFYPIQKYLGKTFLGNKTIAYHSSFGCPFTCSFCGIVPIYNARWKGRSAEKIYQDIKFLTKNFGGDAIEFHDNNFFVSEKRTVEFSRLMLNENMSWWGEGRIDTLDKFKDDSLKIMRDSGCKMIFLGAESGSNEVLKQMDKGGTQTSEQIKKFAYRMAQFDIIPEMSFVLGTPANSEDQVRRQIEEDILFIKEIKKINPNAEIIIYVYSPVPTEGSELYKKVMDSGFHYPQNLEDWISPEWENFDLRKNPLTPWLKPDMVSKIKNFETVLNGFYPTISDTRVRGIKRKFLKSVSGVRYRSNFYQFPYEVKLLQKIWKYRQPEIQGFYSE